MICILCFFRLAVQLEARSGARTVLKRLDTLFSSLGPEEGGVPALELAAVTAAKETILALARQVSTDNDCVL